MGFNILLFAGLLVAQLILQRLAIRKPRGERPEFDPPSVEEGRRLPLIFGTQRVVPTIAWYGDTETDDGDNDSTEYYARMVCWLGLGPLTRILDLQWGDKSLALHPATNKSNDADLDYVTLPTLPIARTDAAGTPKLVKVHALDLFGGPKVQGGVAGQLWIHWGTRDQAIQPVVDEHFNAGTEAENEASAWPRYAYIVLGASAEDGPYGSYEDLLEDGQFLHTSNAPQPQDFAAIVEHIPTGLLELDLDAGYTSSGLTFAQEIEAARIGQDANPAEVIYAVAADPVLGAGRAAVELELASLVALAKTCRAEQLGVSLTVDGQSALEVIDEVLRHIDGVRYEDPATGKLAVKLLRADYVLSEQVEVTPSNATDIRVDRVATGNEANELRVRYSHYEAGTGRGSVVGEVLTTDLQFNLFVAALLQTDGRNLSDVTVYADGVPLTEGEDEDYQVLAASGVIFLDNTDNTESGQTITIDYTGSATFLGYREGLTAPAQNLADIAETGHVRSETLDFPWLTTERNALIAQARQMTRAVRRLRVLEWTMNREGYGLHVGAVVRVNLPKHGLVDQAYRLTRVEEAPLEEGGIQCWAVEDVFALPLNPSLPAGGGDDPAGGLPTAPAIALSVVTPGAIRIGLHPADTSFQIEVRRADDALGTGATTITPAGGLPGTTPYLDDPWAESTVKFYSGRLIRSGWLPGPWSPWLEATATAGTPGEPSCVVPTWATSKSETASDGTATLTPTDPQLRILSVEAKTKVGAAAEGGWSELTAPYEQLVAFSGSERSTVTFRVTYLACDGNEVSVEVPVHFDVPVLSSLVAAFDGAGNLTGQFAHTGASIRLAGAIGSAPADATVDGAAAIDQTTGVSGTLATATTAGSVGHVKARLYSGAGGTGRPSAYVTAQVTFAAGVPENALGEATDGDTISVPPVRIEPVPSVLAAIAEWCRYRVLTGHRVARLEADVVTALAGAKLVLLGSTDDGASYDYLDGLSGPAILLSNLGKQLAAWGEIDPAYLTGDVRVALGLVGGDDASAVDLQAVATEYAAFAPAVGPPPGGGDLDPEDPDMDFWLEADVGVTVSGSDITAWQNQVVGGVSPTPEAAPQLVLVGGVPTARLAGGSRFRFPNGSYTGRTAGHLFQVIQCDNNENAASGAGHGDWSGAGNAFLGWSGSLMLDYGTDALKIIGVAANGLTLTVPWLLEVEWDATHYIVRINGVEVLNVANTFSGFNVTPIMGPANFQIGLNSTHNVFAFLEWSARRGLSQAAQARSYLMNKYVP